MRSGRTPFLERLQDAALVCDGAMGTMLYSQGVYINRCFDELNLSAPDLVRDVHKAYTAAHADIIETNTFGANRLKLRAHGLDDKVALINRTGAELAREAAGDSVYVAGAIGPMGTHLAPLGNLQEAEAEPAFAEQIKGLLAGGVDLFLFETFSDVNELVVAVRLARRLSDLPIMAQMSFDDDGVTRFGITAETVVERLNEAGADVVGANCSVGPQTMLDVIERMARHGAKLISAQPNAGNPRMVEGRVIYMSTPEYHAEFARRFIKAGANVVGGCCGTTPEHIKAIANAVRAMQPRRTAVSVLAAPKKEEKVTPIPREEKSALAARLARKFVVSVEVLSPRGFDVNDVLNGVRRLVGFGVDAVNIPDGPRASSRMSPMALAQIIERTLPVETILHYCCRDRNLLGMQSDLLGNYALGLRNILAITGDPPKLGDYPDATAVFDVDSIGLCRMLSGLNRGYDVAGNFIGRPTGWHVGVGANPGSLDLELEIKRLYQKVEAGAEYILTQPVFDVAQLIRFFERVPDIKVPVLAGIMPLITYRTVEFLNNEVPGVTVPEPIVQAMAAAADAEQARRIGIDIAQKAILEIRRLPQVKGLYLMPPFSKDKYDIAMQVLDVLQ